MVLVSMQMVIVTSELRILEDLIARVLLRQSALQTKKHFFVPRSQGARRNALRAHPSLLSDRNDGRDTSTGGANTTERMSSFGGFEETHEYLTDQYSTTYRDSRLQRPPSRQGTAFPMGMDAEKEEVGETTETQLLQRAAVNLADLDINDDPSKANNREKLDISEKCLLCAEEGYSSGAGNSRAGEKLK